jgi:hypothetical protein
LLERQMPANHAVYRFLPKQTAAQGRPAYARLARAFR